MALLYQFLQRRNGQMRFSRAGRSHQQQTLFRGPGVILNKFLSQQLGSCERLCVLSRPGLAIFQIGRETLEVAMLIAFRNARPLHYFFRALFHAAFASHSHLAGRAILARHQLPTRPLAKCAIFPSHVLPLECGSSAPAFEVTTVLKNSNGEPVFLPQKRRQSRRTPHKASYVPSPRLTIHAPCGNLCTKSKSPESLEAFRRFLFAVLCYLLTIQRGCINAPLSYLHNPRPGPHNRVLRYSLTRLRGHSRQLLLHHVRKLAHLAFHLDHLLAHIQDDLDSRQVHAHVPRQRQNHVEPLQVRIRIQPRVALRTRWLQQTHAFVQPQRLRMQLINFRNGADHVACFGAFSGLWRHGLHTPALTNKSLRGSAGAISSSSFIRLRTRSSVGSGTTT